MKGNKNRSSCKGTSLLEVVIAITILGIIVTAGFAGIFSESAKGVSETGQRNKAMSKIAGYMDMLYANGCDVSVIPDSETVDDEEDLYEYENEYDYKIFKKAETYLDNVVGHTVTIVYFYKEDEMYEELPDEVPEEMYVEMTSFIRTGG